MLECQLLHSEVYQLENKYLTRQRAKLFSLFSSTQIFSDHVKYQLAGICVCVSVGHLSIVPVLSHFLQVTAFYFSILPLFSTTAPHLRQAWQLLEPRDKSLSPPLAWSIATPRISPCKWAATKEHHSKAWLCMGCRGKSMTPSIVSRPPIL